jgi:hypothetical protein
MTKITTTGSLPSLTRGTTYEFYVTIASANITADTVTLTLKRDIDDSDANAALQADADVTTDGANGVAIFSLSKTDTDIAPGKLWYDIIWYKSNGDELRISAVGATLQILERVSDP